MALGTAGGRRFTPIAVRGAGERPEGDVVPGVPVASRTRLFPSFADLPPQSGDRGCFNFLRGDQRRARLRAGHTSITDLTLMTAHLNEVASSPQSVAGRATAETAETSTAACEKNTWAYLDGKCIPGRARKPRSLRAATNSPLGRSGLSVPVASRLSPKSGAATTVSAPVTTKSTAQLNPVLKKAQKTATRQTSG